MFGVRRHSEYTEWVLRTGATRSGVTEGWSEEQAEDLDGRRRAVRAGAAGGKCVETCVDY